MQSLALLLKGTDEQIKDYLKHPRHKILDEMLKLINRDREGTKYKQLTMKAVAVKTSHLGIDDMGYLLKRMQQSSYPGKVFFGSLKIK